MCRSRVDRLDCLWSFGTVDVLLSPSLLVVVAGVLFLCLAVLVGDVASSLRLLGVPSVSGVLGPIVSGSVPHLGLVPMVSRVPAAVAPVVSFPLPPAAAAAGVPGGVLAVGAVLAALVGSLGVVLLGLLVG